MERLQKKQHTCNGNTKSREKETEEIFEIIMTEDFPKLISDPKPQIEEAQRPQSKKKPTNYT